MYKDRITKNDCLKQIKAINKRYSEECPGEFKHVELQKLETKQWLVSIISIHWETHIKFGDLFWVWNYLENIDKDIKELLWEDFKNVDITWQQTRPIK